MENFAPVATLAYKGLQQPYFEYFSPMWGTWRKLLKNKLERLRHVLLGMSQVPVMMYSRLI